MTIRMYLKNTLSNGDVVISEDRMLKVGVYNEFYIPALFVGNRPTEGWVEITEDDGTVTTLHLKR